METAKESERKAQRKDAEGKDGRRERTKVRHGYVGVERKSLYLLDEVTKKV